MRTSAATETATRYVGNCQLCEGDQKLHHSRMVHHGYQRPGHGSIEGDCPGVGKDPYEVSCELVKAYRGNLGTQLVQLEKRLTALKGGTVRYLTKLERCGAMVQYIAGVTEPFRWEQALTSAIYGIESDIRQCKSEIERCTRRIAAWKPMPIRTVEEEVRKEQMAKAERAKIVADKRAAKAAKEAATRAKQEALKAKRSAIRKEFENRFRTLAADSKDQTTMLVELNKKTARSLLVELDKTKYRSWLSRYDLECEEAFVALGLAVQEGVNGRGRPYLRWV
jgi:hypothetical protein